MKLLTCKLPANLNTAFASNQVNDATCKGDICPRYSAIREALKEKLCTINWQRVSAVMSGG